jgi:hypothetical protein
MGCPDRLMKKALESVIIILRIIYKSYSDINMEAAQINNKRIARQRLQEPEYAFSQVQSMHS